jgi:dTDP-4-amino-4,6-dideoxygalactose transaminase
MQKMEYGFCVLHYPKICGVYITTKVNKIIEDMEYINEHGISAFSENYTMESTGYGY